MSTIQEKINTLQPYLSGIRYLDGLQLVDATFKDGWVIPDSKIIKKEIIETNYFMFYSEDKTVTIDDLLDYIGSIIELNIEREKKYELLKTKVKELQELFKEHPLSKLETLKFSFNQTNTDNDLPDFSLFDTKVDSNKNETSTEEQNIHTIEDEYYDEDEDEYEKEARLHEEAAIRAQQEKLINKVGGNTKIKNKSINNIELPPRNGSVEVEVYDLPEEMKEGDCDCGPEEACPKCLDNKSL
jgi:hypothetical protein